MICKLNLRVAACGDETHFIVRSMMYEGGPHFTLVFRRRDFLILTQNFKMGGAKKNSTVQRRRRRVEELRALVKRCEEELARAKEVARIAADDYDRVMGATERQTAEGF